MSGEEVVDIDKNSETIVRAILKMAEDRARAIRKEAEERANEIIGSAKEEADIIIKAKRERIERELREEVARKRSAAEVEANQLILRMKTELLNELFRRVNQKLAAISEGQDLNWEYKELLAKYSLEGAKALEEKRVYLMGRENDKKLLESISKELGKRDIEALVNDKTIPIIGGVVVRDERDMRRYYNTFDGRFGAYKEAKEIEIIQRLFGEA